MNTATFKKIITSSPVCIDESYIFLTDNIDLASNIILSEYRCVAIIDNKEGFFSLESFLDYLADIDLKGTYLSDYTFVPACLLKKKNDTLTEYFSDHYITFREGWTLFKGKEYLMNLDHNAEMKKILGQFIKRYEKKPETEPDLDRYHIITDAGKPSGPLDIAIVEHIIETNSYFVLDKDVYVYRHGVYLKDLNGAILKEEIRKLLYRKYMRSNYISRIYALLIGRPGIQRSLYEMYNFPSHWINFRNGFYDPVDQKTKFFLMR